MKAPTGSWLWSLRSFAARLGSGILVLPVVLYQRVISPFKPRTCRFEPSCSEYARIALLRHGPLKGSWLSVRRLLRCHPFTEPGEDPVPDRRPRGDTPSP